MPLAAGFHAAAADYAISADATRPMLIFRFAIVFTPRHIHAAIISLRHFSPALFFFFFFFFFHAADTPPAIFRCPPRRCHAVSRFRRCLRRDAAMSLRCRASRGGTASERRIARAARDARCLRYAI